MKPEQRLEKLKQLKRARSIVTRLEAELKADKPAANSTQAAVKSVGGTDDVAGILLSNNIISADSDPKVIRKAKQPVAHLPGAPSRIGMATLIT